MDLSRRSFLRGSVLAGVGAVAGARLFPGSAESLAAPPTPPSGAAKPKGIALAVGLNSVDPKHYAGWSGLLQACENDANDMLTIAKSQGFASTRLLTKQATRQAVIGGLRKAAQTLSPGGMFMLSYSGHGGQVPDQNGDEIDGKDETWCLYDGEMIDDELDELWSEFPKGVRILVFSDSCHSGTVTKAAEFLRSWTAAPPPGRRGAALQPRFKDFLRPRDPAVREAPSPIRAMPDKVAEATFKQNREFYVKLGKSVPSPKASRGKIEATVLLISGCQDKQLSADGDENGLFTGTLKDVWNNGSFRGDYRNFHSTIKAQMPKYQVPNYYVIGASNSAFEAQRPFTI